MGWLSFPMHRPVKEWFKEGIDSKYEVVDSALVKRNTFYAAIKDKETGLVFCAIYLIRWSRSYYNFSYKDMSEFAGPYSHDCPQRIVKLLSPLNDENDPNGWARDWRKRVEEYWQKRDELKKSKGCVLKTKEPVNFTNGSDYQYFKKEGRTMYAGMVVDNCFRALLRVRFNISRYEYEVVPNLS